MADMNDDLFDIDAFKPYDQQITPGVDGFTDFNTQSSNGISQSVGNAGNAVGDKLNPSQSGTHGFTGSGKDMYDGNLASIDKVFDNADDAVDSVVDSNGKQGLLSKITHGAIDTTENAGKGFIKGIKNYLNPKVAADKAKQVGTKSVDGLSKGLNIGKGVAKGIIGSAIASTIFGAYMVGSNINSTIKSDLILTGDEYIHECIVTNAEDVLGGGNGEKGADNEDAEKQLNAYIVTETLRELGYSDDFIAGCISCWLVESNMLCARLESDFVLESESEAAFMTFGSGIDVSPYYGSIADGATSYSAYTAYGDGPYTSLGNSGGTTLNGGYFYDGHTCPGFGLVQWTASRGAKIMQSVDATQAAGYEYSVIDMPYQLAFALSEWEGNDKLSWEGGAWSSLTGEAAVEFCFRYIEFGGGQPPADLTAKRVARLEDAKSLMNASEQNAEYMENVTPMASILAESEVSGSKRDIFEATLCMTTAHNELDSIPMVAYSLAYVLPMDYSSTDHAVDVSKSEAYANRLLAPRIITDETKISSGKARMRACSEYYVLAHFLVANDIAYKLDFSDEAMKEDIWWSSCDRSTATIIRAAGADDRFRLGAAEGQVDYMYTHSGGSIEKSSDLRYCGGKDSNKLWDAVGYIENGYYYPYGTGVSLSPGSILISGGTTGSTTNPTGDDYYCLSKRISSNNFLNFANSTTGHIITYSGSAALKSYYGDTLVEEWWKYDGTGNHPNGASDADYDTLVMDDMKLGVSGDMNDGNSNKTTVADKSNDKYATYYTAVSEAEADDQINAKTGLMTFKSRGELYCDIVEQLINNGYTQVDGVGFEYSGTEAITGDPNNDTCLSGMDHPYSWPIWKIDAYVDLCYRYQQMVRFSTASEFVSIPSEQDTNTYRAGGGDTNTYYVYSYGFRHDDYAEILSYDEDVSKALYDNGAGTVWYYGKAFEYRYMVSNDMLQDLIQLFTVKDPADYSASYAFVNGYDQYLARMSNGKLLLGPGGNGLENNYGLTPYDWEAILQYCNEGAARLDLDVQADFINTWFTEVTNLNENITTDFDFDASKPYDGGGFIEPSKLSGNSLKWVAANLFLHNDASGKHMWAVYHRDNGGKGFETVEELAKYYQQHASETDLDNIIVNGYTSNKLNQGVPSYFYGKTLNPHRILDQCTDKLNDGASVMNVDLNGGALSCSVTRGCSCGSTCGDSDPLTPACTCTAPRNISFSGIDAFAQSLAAKQIDFNVTVVISCKGTVTYAYTANNCTDVSNTFGTTVRDHAHAKPKAGCHNTSDDHDDVITIYIQMAEYEGADSLVEAGDIFIDRSALAGHLASMAASKDPIYMKVYYSSGLLNHTPYKDTILIDASFNEYKRVDPTYEDPKAEDFYYNTVCEVEKPLAKQMIETSNEVIIGKCVDDQNADGYKSDAVEGEQHTVPIGSNDVNEFDSCYFHKLCGVNPNNYASDGSGPPQHLIFTGLGGCRGTYIQAPGASKPSMVNANIDPSPFYDETLDDPEHENYISDPNAKKMNTELKNLHGYGFWNTDGSIGSHGPEAKYRDFGSYFTDHSYRVFVNQSATDKKNIDKDYHLSDDGLRFELIDEETGLDNWNDSEALIYGVIADEGYRYYEDTLTWDEQKVVGQGENSFYARLMHIWNGYEEILLSNMIHEEVEEESE